MWTAYTEPLRIPALAAHVNMSTSCLYEHFRAAIGMTPLQYQKALRLGEARRLMAVDSFNAATAANTVGYASPSQFSREYRRLYGRSPYRDAQALRGVPAPGEYAEAITRHTTHPAAQADGGTGHVRPHLRVSGPSAVGSGP